MSTLKESNLLTQPTGSWNTDIERYNQGLLMTAPNIADYAVSAGGIGNYGTYNGIGLDKAAYDAINDSGATIGLDKSLMGYGTDALDGLKEFDWSKAGLAAEIYDKLIGTGADFRQAQLDLLNQKLANNAEAMKDREAYQANVASGANSGVAAGLAAANATSQPK